MNAHKHAPKFHVLLAAAGSGTRTGHALPKQYIKINQQPILRYTINNVLSWPGIQTLRVIIDPSHADLYQDAIQGLNLDHFIPGSGERKLSIYNGLKGISNLKNEDIVLIHDAARPFTHQNDIKNLLNSLSTHRASTLAVAVSDTLYHEEGKIIDRDRVWAIQTPQVFRYGDILRAHETAPKNLNYTDDASLARAIGIEVKLVQSEHMNFKITTARDLDLAEKILKPEYSIRTGIGFDVHAFDSVNISKKPLILCGIEVDHTFALIGHSDADVGLHAITDALLGALALGDIGQHFPPSEPKYKNMNSGYFLEKALSFMNERGAIIENIDVTLICEHPKIGPYREQMCQRISEITKICTSQINVKATTTEGLGFTGRSEGIAAQAIVTLKARKSGT